MKTGFAAFLKKEWTELARSGRLLILLVMFLLFGIMNPAIAKLTPWLMEQMAEQLAEAGLSKQQNRHRYIFKNLLGTVL